ncbi:hypothetical protein AAFF_G00125030 [Aldrovandia affinis]|uniref:FHA domain-containing protein n=1 Tax=Aldrovandia affinis TaxID=143900 RepID=A0AAD7RRL4_9TELE|nr:hypothetical protein AAFF_G00125030 [Aldrovandia affinis]
MRGYLKTLGWVFKLQPKTKVGRHEDSDLCLQNGGVEEHHALIELSESERCFVLRDLNSTHGTFVNECRIHNAAVNLTPGDELYFGFGGPSYQLVVDSPSPPTYPPVNQRLAWQIPLQLIEESGPARARPASAGTKRSGPGHSTEHRVASLRPGSWNGNVNGNGNGISGGVHSLRNTVTSQSTQALQHLLQEKEERLLRLGDEVSRLTVFEGESRRKDGVIAGLRDEVSALRHQLTQSRADPEVHGKLRGLEKDIGDKKEQIEQLKEQMVELQKGSSEVFKHSLAERDLRIAGLRTQVEKLKKDGSMSSGLVTSLQKDLSTREKQTLKLAAEVDRLRQDVRHKDAQLGSMSAKVSRSRENQKHQEELVSREKEAVALKKRAENLEQALAERRTELQHQAAERDSLRGRLEEERQRWESSQAEVEAGRQQLQESRQREQRSRVELERIQARLERFRSRIIQTTYSAPGVSALQDTVSDQEAIEQMTEIIEEKEGLGTRVRELEEQQKEISTEREELRARVQELEGQVEEQDRIATEALGFRSRLEECQSRLQGALSVPALQREISALQDQPVPQSLAWVQSAALFMLAAPMAQLQEVGRALQDAGVDESAEVLWCGEPHVSNPCVWPHCRAPAGIRALWHQSQERELLLRALQMEVEEVRGERDALVQGQEEQVGKLQGQLTTLKEQLERQRQQVLDAQREEEEGLKAQLEEMRKELESLRSTEASLREEARAKEAELQARAEEAERKGAELERECYRRLSGATQRVRDAEQERDRLREQLTDLESRLESSEPAPSPPPSPAPLTPGKAPEVMALEETVTLLRVALAEARQEAVAQGDVVAALSRDLAGANARMSDMTGELSERQKVELERHRALVVDQRVQLSTLTQKLARMSNLVDQKGEELQSVRETLRQCQEALETRAQADREREEQKGEEQTDTSLLQTPVQEKESAAAARTGGAGVKEALAELRAKVKALEQSVPMMSTPELCVQQVALMRRELCELRAQKAAAYRGAADSTTVASLPGTLSEETLERTARLDLSDTLDLSEQTYLDLARALHEALELSEGQLAGSGSLKHLPRDERERLASRRQRDVELLQTRLGLLKSQARSRDELLQERHTDVTTLRESQAAGQQLQARLDGLRAELQAECQESSLLREALQRTQSRLEQETGLNRAIKERKEVECGEEWIRNIAVGKCSLGRFTKTSYGGLSVEQLEKRSARTPSHSCVRDDAWVKAATRKASLQEKLKKREYEIEVLKKQLRNGAARRPASARAPVPSEAN